MNASCPACGYLFPRSSRGRLLGGLWTPRTAACPSCGARVQWVKFFWRLQLAGGLLLIPALFRSVPGFFRLTFLGASATLVVIAIIKLRLQRELPVDSSDS